MEMYASIALVGAQVLSISIEQYNFFGEILHFHRMIILAYLRRNIAATPRMMRRAKNDLFHKRIWRFIGRGIAAAPRIMRWINKWPTSQQNVKILRADLRRNAENNNNAEKSAN